MSVKGVFGRLAAAGLRRLDAETAHGLALRALSLGLVPGDAPPPDPRLAIRFVGLSLANPVGLAAGFDKNARAADALLGLGFGFVEIGTVTPLAQPGNPRPRMFRLTEDRAIINRLGFNNEGHDAVFARLDARKKRGGIVGVNIGANKDSTDRIADYVIGIQRFAGLADYFTINVSSPNTPGLRDLQARVALDDLLARSVEARDVAGKTQGRRVPVLLKIAPDMDEAGYDDVAEVALARGVDGLIISNTTLSRAGLQSRHRGEAGGLSGRPLFERATIILARMRQRLGPALPIIGVGGISTADDVVARIAAGADVVQVYSDFIYQGPEMPGRLCRGLSALMDQHGLSSIAALRDRDVGIWAGRSIPA